MIGRLVPLVLLPRYTTLVGGGDDANAFATIGIDVSPYDVALVTVWRGAILGDAPPTPPPTVEPFRVWFDESTDQETWNECFVSPSEHDPGENTQVRYEALLTKRWLRLRVELEAANNIATCFAVGFLQERTR